MIKGINRHMIEVTDTNSDYYERAFLLVKPQYEKIQQSVLEKEAKSIFRRMGAPSSMNKKHKWLYWCIRLIPAVLLGIGITLTAIHLF